MRGPGRRPRKRACGGALDDAALHGLYRRAALFLFPSLYEGHSMPVLEAMAAGCPPSAPRLLRLAEVAGDAALTAPADHPAALAAHCRLVLADEALRRRLMAAGQARAGAFDVASMGRSLLKWL